MAEGLSPSAGTPDGGWDAGEFYEEGTVRVRQGRHNDQIVYIQLGAEPSDDDQMLAVFMDPARAQQTVAIMNGYFFAGPEAE